MNNLGKDFSFVDAGIILVGLYLKSEGWTSEEFNAQLKKLAEELKLKGERSEFINEINEKIKEILKTEIK